MKLSTVIQNSAAYDTGHSIGFIVGKYLPLIVLIVIAYLIYRYIKKSKK